MNNIFNFDFEANDCELDDSEKKELSEDDLKSFSNEKLCSIIVCSRYLLNNSDLALKCINELGNRRSNGDSFNYEEYIELQLKKMPKINIQGTLDMFGNFINLKGK